MFFNIMILNILNILELSFRLDTTLHEKELLQEQLTTFKVEDLFSALIVSQTHVLSRICCLRKFIFFANRKQDFNVCKI